MTDLFPPADQPQLDENKDYLKELTGPGGKFDRTKYKDDLEMYQAIAKGKALADQMVDLKNQREDDLRAEYKKVVDENKTKADLQELIDQMQQARLANSEHTPAKEDTVQPLKLEDMDSIFDQKYEARRLRERQEENLNQVQNKLKSTWGDNFQRVLKQKTEELDLSEQDVLSMAKSNPKLLYRTMGLDQQPEQNLFSAPPRSQQRNDSFAPSGPKERTWSYYQELKKSNPQLYFDRKTAVQMMKDAETLGERFHDGNYFVKGLHENN